jgi:Mrp family chromosome partitioning ATPase
MLLECALRRPSIAEEFGLPAGPGLSQVLSGRLLGDESLALHSPLPNLHVMTSGTIEGDPQELLASPRMGALLEAARQRYDLVVLDTPPVLPVADALVLAGQADGTLMLVRWEKTARVAVRDAARLLRNSRARMMGTVMTIVDMRTASIVGGRMLHSLDYYNGYHAERSPVRA